MGDWQADSGSDAATALRDAAKMLSAISDTPRLDAELLLAHALDMDRTHLLLDLPKLSAPPSFAALLTRRQQSEPVAYITGTKEFWGLDLQVSPAVLIPRPDSETLIETALKIFHEQSPANILDLGTGSGALLLAALTEFPQATGIGIDASAAALEIAHNNGDWLKLSKRAKFLLLDWTRDDWTMAFDQRFDLILANPPYVAEGAKLAADVADYEPGSALFSGSQGLDDYQILIPSLPQLLSEDGIALLEIGFDQAEPVRTITKESGFHANCVRDLGGNNRVLVLRR